MERLLSASLVLFVSAIFSLLLFHLTFHMHYGFFTRTLYLLWSILQFALALSLYKLTGRPLTQFFKAFEVYREIKKKNKELEATNSLFLVGLFLLTITPFLYTYLSTHNYPTHYAILSLLLGGVAVAGALADYISQ